MSMVGRLGTLFCLLCTTRVDFQPKYVTMSEFKFLEQKPTTHPLAFDSGYP